MGIPTARSARHRRTTITQCKQCGKDFLTSRTKPTKFCSPECVSTSFRTPRVAVACGICGKPLEIRKPRFTRCKSKIFFCSKGCKDMAARCSSGVPIQPAHYGTGIGSRAYRRIAFEHYAQRCARCGYAAHPEILQVHHKDRNRSNNDPNNLEVLCRNCHVVEHYNDAEERSRTATDADFQSAALPLGHLGDSTNRLRPSGTEGNRTPFITVTG